VYTTSKFSESVTVLDYRLKLFFAWKSHELWDLQRGTETEGKQCRRRKQRKKITG